MTTLQRRASIVIAVLVVAWAVTPALAEDESTLSVATGNFSAVAGLGALAVQVVGRLSESGVLLLWGTGLAAVSRALSRKPSSGK